MRGRSWNDRMALNSSSIILWISCFRFLTLGDSLPSLLQVAGPSALMTALIKKQSSNAVPGGQRLGFEFGGEVTTVDSFGGFPRT